MVTHEPNPEEIQMAGKKSRQDALVDELLKDSET
jgi:hypothetical protein